MSSMAARLAQTYAEPDSPGISRKEGESARSYTLPTRTTSSEWLSPVCGQPYCIFVYLW